MPRYKFQTPQGSIIMEFEDTTTVFQVRTLLSQTLKRPAIAIRCPVTNLSSRGDGTSSRREWMSQLLDSLRMKEVDKRTVLIVECEPEPRNEPDVKLITPSSKNMVPQEDTSISPSESDIEVSEMRVNGQKSYSEMFKNSKPSLANGNEAAPNPQYFSTTEAKQSSGNDCTKTASSKCTCDKADSQEGLNVAHSVIIPFLSLFGSQTSSAASTHGSTVANHPLPFNPILLHPSVMKYCIHFEIEKFKINPHIFSTAALGADSGSLEETLALHPGELLDSSGKFLPIISLLMKSEAERGQIYDELRNKLRASTGVQGYLLQSTPATSVPWISENHSGTSPKPSESKGLSVDEKSSFPEDLTSSVADSSLKPLMSSTPPPPLYTVEENRELLQQAGGDSLQTSPSTNDLPLIQGTSNGLNHNVQFQQASVANALLHQQAIAAMAASSNLNTFLPQATFPGTFTPHQLAAFKQHILQQSMAAGSMSACPPPPLLRVPQENHAPLQQQPLPRVPPTSAIQDGTNASHINNIPSLPAETTCSPNVVQTLNPAVTESPLHSARKLGLNHSFVNSSVNQRMRRRTTINKAAKKAMIDWYLANGRYLTNEGKIHLSTSLKLTEENVRVFFKNMRRIEKKAEVIGVSLHDMMGVVDLGSEGQQHQQQTSSSTPNWYQQHLSLFSQGNHLSIGSGDFLSSDRDFKGSQEVSQLMGTDDDELMLEEEEEFSGEDDSSLGVAVGLIKASHSPPTLVVKQEPRLSSMDSTI